MIKSIFYARFHHLKGSRVLHQVPDGSITPSRFTRHREPLFQYSSISDFIIPKQDFCDRLFTVCVSHYRIIGYPVCINDYSGKYGRNQFIFNFALVIDEDLEDWGSYASVVRKLGRLLRALEEQGGFLSKEEDPSWFEDNEDESVILGSPDSSRQDKTSSAKDHESENGSPAQPRSGGKTVPMAARTGSPRGSSSKVYALCEMILEDLNNYYECMIPIDESNTINLKLFPTRPQPAPVYAWHVPLLTIDLSAFSSRNVSSDLTLQRILPYVNGITSVAHISQLADTDLGLTRKAIQHLVYYGCVILLDVFQFGAVYAPTAEIGSFVVDENTQEECARYVQVPRNSPASKSIGSVQADAAVVTPTNNQQQRGSELTRPAAAKVTDHRSEITGELLVKLYTSLKQGLILRNWCLENMDLLAGIDVRRLITFGVIKGFLYRVHKYAIATSSSIPNSEKQEQTAMSFRVDDPKSSRKLSASEDAQIHDIDAPKASKELPLEKFLDGIHSFDEICTELRMNEREVLGKIKGFGDVQIISR